MAPMLPNGAHQGVAHALRGMPALVELNLRDVLSDEEGGHHRDPAAGERQWTKVQLEWLDDQVGAGVGGHGLKMAARTPQARQPDNIVSDSSSTRGFARR